MNKACVKIIALLNKKNPKTIIKYSIFYLLIRIFSCFDIYDFVFEKNNVKSII